MINWLISNLIKLILIFLFKFIFLKIIKNTNFENFEVLELRISKILNSELRKNFYVFEVGINFWNFYSKIFQNSHNVAIQNNSPSFIPGFTIGLNRIFMTNWSKHNLKYIIRL